MLFIIIITVRSSSAHTWSMGELSKCCSGPCGLTGGLPGPHGGHALTGSRAQQPRARVGVPAEASAREVKRGGERGKLKVAGFLLHRQMV